MNTLVALMILVQLLGITLGNCPEDETTTTTTTGIPSVTKQPLPSQYHTEITRQNPPKPSATKLHQETVIVSTSTEHYTSQTQQSYRPNPSSTKQTSQVETMTVSTSVEYQRQFTQTEYEPRSSNILTIDEMVQGNYFVQATPTPFSQYTHNTAVNSPPECQCLVLEDCMAWYDEGATVSGIYSINPDNGEPFQVYCDMVTDGGGWTVFQRRIDGSVDFYRGWSDYEEGFGNLTGEFWLGLTKIHRLTKTGDKQLRIDLGDFENNYRYAKCSSFSVGDNISKYILNVAGYSGDVGDSITAHTGQKFTTKDGDNDIYAEGNCASLYKGGWWYGACHSSNLNGLYLAGRHRSYADGVEWYHWTKQYYSLRYTEMKLK